MLPGEQRNSDCQYSDLTAALPAGPADKTSHPYHPVQVYMQINSFCSLFLTGWKLYNFLQEEARMEENVLVNNN